MPVELRSKQPVTVLTVRCSGGGAVTMGLEENCTSYKRLTAGESKVLH